MGGVITKKRLLVIDDDPRFRALVEDVFSSDFEVSGTQDWTRGVEACRSGGADLVMLDMRMPMTDGLSVARALEAQEETREVPVVIVTASELDVPTRLALRAQANVRRTVDKLSGMKAIREAISLVAEL